MEPADGVIIYVVIYLPCKQLRKHWECNIQRNQIRLDIGSMVVSTLNYNYNYVTHKIFLCYVQVNIFYFNYNTTYKRKYVIA
jgi:hypothetical protein